jgi:hypothetical protein
MKAKIAGIRAANEDRVKPKLPRITSWRGAMKWLQRSKDGRGKDPKILREMLLQFYVFWVTDGLQDVKSWELREDYADLLLKGCKPASPREFNEACKEGLEDDRSCPDPDDWFDLRSELEDYFKE